MAFWTTSAVGLVIAYLFGSTPTGYLAGKLLKGIDIREHGSKSTGATNVLRTLGKWPALVVLIADVLKGVGAIIVARSFCPWLYTELSSTPPTAVDLQIWVPWAVCLAGIAVLLGHSRSIWLNFAGAGWVCCWRCRGQWDWVLRRSLASCLLLLGLFPLARYSRR
jgi:acyl phosphate:glycerol-3-phosphate acyltransferase